MALFQPNFTHILYSTKIHMLPFCIYRRSFLRHPVDTKCGCFRLFVLRVSPTPRVTWSRLDSAMPTKNWNASFGQELVIVHAEFSDSGRYQCTAVNTASGSPRAVIDFTLTVECTYSTAGYISCLGTLCFT